jgi:hypothetical protein
MHADEGRPFLGYLFSQLYAQQGRDLTEFLNQIFQ